MKATKGRASYVGERSIGHIDPGSYSSGLLFEALLESGGKSMTNSSSFLIKWISLKALVDLISSCQRCLADLCRWQKMAALVQV